MKFELRVNRERVALDSPPDKPLLWVLREELGLTGTKFGCGIGVCGACTVQLDGAAVRACVIPISATDGKAITTVEGLTGSDGTPSAAQASWRALQVPQCGYCQSGMLMAATALLAEHPVPTDAQIDAAMTNLCRCGTYPRVRAAIHRTARVSSAAPRA